MLSQIPWEKQCCNLIIGKLGKLVHCILHDQLHGKGGATAQQVCLLSLLPEDISHLKFKVGKCMNLVELNLNSCQNKLHSLA